MPQIIKQTDFIPGTPGEEVEAHVLDIDISGGGLTVSSTGNTATVETTYGMVPSTEGKRILGDMGASAAGGDMSVEHRFYAASQNERPAHLLRCGTTGTGADPTNGYEVNWRLPISQVVLFRFDAGVKTGELQPTKSITIDHTSGSDGKMLLRSSIVNKTITAEYSTDDGVTWTTAFTYSDTAVFHGTEQYCGLGTKQSDLVANTQKLHDLKLTWVNSTGSTLTTPNETGIDFAKTAVDTTYDLLQNVSGGTTPYSLISISRDVKSGDTFPNFTATFDANPGSSQIQWNPAHCGMGNGPTLYSDIAANPNILSVKEAVFWGEIESAEGVYDWTLIDSLVANVKAVGKTLFVQIAAKAFNNNAVALLGGPQYLRTQGGIVRYNINGTEKDVAIQWYGYVNTAYNNLLAAFGARYLNEPTVAGVIFEETALGMGSAANRDLLAPGYTWPLYEAALLASMAQVRQSMPDRLVFQMANALSTSGGPQPDQSLAMQDFFDKIALLGGGVSGPDIKINMTTAGALYAANAGLLPLALDNQRATNSVTEATPQASYDRAVTTQKCNFVFWTRNNLVGFNWAADIEPMLVTNSYAIETAIPSNIDNGAGGNNGTTTFKWDGVEQSGTYSGTYTVRDADGNESTGNFSGTIANIAPVSANATITIAENSTTDVDPIALGWATDADGDALRYTIVSAPTAPAASWTIIDDSLDPSTSSEVWQIGAPSISGFSETFTGAIYTAHDADQGGTDNGNLTIIVVAIKANDASFSIQKTSSLLIFAYDNFVDDPAGGGSIVSLGTPSQGGFVEILVSGTQINYLPLPTFEGTEIFTYTVENSGGGATDTGTMTIIVGDSSSLPVASDQTVTATVIGSPPNYVFSVNLDTLLGAFPGDQYYAVTIDGLTGTASINTEIFTYTSNALQPDTVTLSATTGLGVITFVITINVVFSTIDIITQPITNPDELVMSIDNRLLTMPT